jgi:antitoxin component of RelBE/YafQ-DinJ toxin-antitoxin module
MRANAAVKVRPPVRVRYLPPTLEEAVFAAQGLTDDAEHQAEIASELMGVTVSEAVEMIRKATAATKRVSRPAEVAFSVDRTGTHRAVVVERKPSFTIARKPAMAPRVEHDGGATVERKPFRGLGAGTGQRTLIRLGGSGR